MNCFKFTCQRNTVLIEELALQFIRTISKHFLIYFCQSLSRDVQFFTAYLRIFSLWSVFVDKIL